MNIKMKKFLFSVCLMIVSLLGFGQWYPLSSGTTYNLYTVSFVDANIGYAGGYTRILKTTDGGATWSNKYMGSDIIVYSLFSIDENTGYCAAYNNFYYVGVIYKTTNGWEWYAGAGSFGTTVPMRSVYFIDINNGFVCSEQGDIWRTTNAGVNWNNFGIGFRLFSVFFPDDNTGYAVGEYGCFVKTTNKGTTWRQLPCGVINDLNSVYFTDVNNGYLVGTEGKILRTTNGGINWTIQTSGTADVLKSVCFINSDTGYVAGNSGLILRTTNGGTTWYKQSSGTNYNLNSVSFPNSGTGYVVGDQGIVLKTTNGGVGFFENNIKIEYCNFNLYPNPTQNKITITLKGLETFSGLILSIYNIQGQMLLQQTLTQNNTEIDISTLQPGVYIAKLKLGDGSEAQKRFVVIR